jgi:MtN3 and saliva related transmembrane protein
MLWDTGKTGDLSLKMFSILATGVAAWVLYGFLKRDIVI